MQKQQEAEQRRKAEMEQRQQQWVFIRNCFKILDD